MVTVVDQVVQPKRKRFNKNKKKAWRKKTDISEVEEILEDERREERYGGPLEERNDSEMMFLDLGDGEAVQTQIDEECTLEYTVDQVPEDKGKVKLKPRQVKVKMPKLKSHQFINGLPGAKPPHKPRKNRGTLTVAMKKKTELQSKDPKIIKKQAEAMKQMVENFQKLTKRPKTIIKTEYNNDLWEEVADEVTLECKKKGLEESFIGTISDYYQRERRMKPVKVPKIRHVATSKLDAVIVPHPGTSYNPSYQSHQNLLHRAVKQEKKYLKKIEKVEKSTTKMFPTIDKAPTEESWLAEMSEGLPKVNEEEEIEEATEDLQEKENEEETRQQENRKQVSNDKITISSKPQNERKTKKVRKKEKRQMLEKLRKQKEKEERIRNNNFYKLKTYQKEIAKEEVMTQNRIASHRARKEQLKSIPRRLGNMKFEEEDLVVNLGDELRGCLRKVKPAVELLEERFKNLQRRNILEPRQKHKMKRKYKRKVVLKRGHREELAKLEQMDFCN